MAELQHKLNSLPGRVSAIKVRTIIGKEWDPEHWNGYMCAVNDDDWDIETLGSAESSQELPENGNVCDLNTFATKKNHLHYTISV